MSKRVRFTVDRTCLICGRQFTHQGLNLAMASERWRDLSPACSVACVERKRHQQAKGAK